MLNTKPRIAVLCATPRFLNAGMLCVDLSLSELLRRLNLFEFTERYCFDLPDDLTAAGSAQTYQPIQEMDSYDKYDLIVIWGDFIVTRYWLNEIVGNMRYSSNTTLDEAKEIVKRRVLLKNCSAEVYEKTIVFGQSLMVDDLTVFEDEEYIPLLRKLITSARFVRFRDPLSAYRANLISGCAMNNYMGVDSALLLHSLGIPETKDDTAERTNRVGIYFCRTVNARLTKLLLAISLRKTFPNYQTCWIPWLKEREHPGLLMKLLFGVPQEGYPDDVIDMLCEIQKCNFIIADTYHIALISWSLGTPAVCIGNGLQKFKRTIDDKKKEVFYSQNYLSDLYLFNEPGWKLFQDGTMRRALLLANDTDLGEKVKGRLSALAQDNIAALTVSIRQILGIAG